MLWGSVCVVRISISLVKGKQATEILTTCTDLLLDLFRPLGQHHCYLRRVFSQASARSPDTSLTGRQCSLELGHSAELRAQIVSGETWLLLQGCL